MIRVMREFLKSLLTELLFPVFLLALGWRCMRYPAYQKKWAERLGAYPFSLKRSIWIHAVSGGEVITIKPIIEQCLLDYPSHPVLITTTTPTGMKQIERLFDNRVHAAFLPYDQQFCVSSFLKKMDPKIGIFVETEIWPTLLHQCQKKSIPTFLVNARLSEKSFKRYHMVKWLLQDSFKSLAHITVQTQIEADRFHQLGVPLNCMTVTGSLKFDVERSPALFNEAVSLRSKLGQERFVWIAASTHRGEEEIILAAHELILKRINNALLVLVPKHPDRFSEVATLAAKKGKIAQRSKKELPNDNVSIYLGDTLGELVLLYAASDVAFVGGSLIEHGGHNLLEPASVKRPILSGRHLFNFQAISDWLLEAKALTLVDDACTLAAAVIKLATEPGEREEKGKCAEKVCATHKGSFQKQYAILKPYF